MFAWEGAGLGHTREGVRVPGIKSKLPVRDGEAGSSKLKLVPLRQIPGPKSKARGTGALRLAASTLLWVGSSLFCAYNGGGQGVDHWPLGLDQGWPQ